jgi:AraC-like DNA-binding protein
MTTSTLSIRIMWPFFRVSPDPEGLDRLAKEGIDLRALADPDTRVPHVLSMALLERAVERTGDLTIGLRAAEHLEPGDLGVFEYAARSCGTLRGALECMRRYIGLLNDSVAPSLEVSGSTAIWRLPVIDGVKQHPCANDFQLACAIVISRRLAPGDLALLEVHFEHPRPASIEHYRNVFPCELRFGMPMNAVVFRRERLDVPLRLANPSLQAAYAIHAEEELRRLEHEKSLSSRVRAVLVSQLRTGKIGLQEVARSLALSPATLRRKLASEGTTLSELLNDVRRDLALKYLSDPSLALTEVAFLLGFSHVPAFYRAFQRWHPNRTPADMRHSLRTSDPAPGASSPSK